MSYRIIQLVGTVIFIIPAHGYEGPLRLWRVTRNEAWFCTALIAIGALFCWWARIYLGSLWSGTITKKNNHHIVDTGPYAIVRHPIYTGLLLAVFVTAIAKGTILGLIGLVLIVAAFWRKAYLEEQWLSEQLGADNYEAYRQRVSMLIPFGPRG